MALRLHTAVVLRGAVALAADIPHHWQTIIHRTMIQRALSTITLLFVPLNSVLFKRLSHSWLAANTKDADTAEGDVSVCASATRFVT